MSFPPAARRIAMAIAFCAVAAPALAQTETHAALQAVNGAGASAWNGSFPFTLRGVLLCDPDEMLDATPQFLPWDNGANQYRMGGEWQVTFQAVDPGDRGGTTCWMGQNYGNQPWIHESDLSYGNEAWVPEVLRLGFDPSSLRQFRAGDLIEVTARQALFYGGKRNINEGHDIDPAFNFDIRLVTPDYGLPAPEVITLADVMQPGGSADDPASWPAIFDATRAAGGEHYQGMRVRLNNLTLVTPNGWNPANSWAARRCTVTDNEGRFFWLRHPRFSLGPAPDGRFDAVGIFSQESGSGSQGTTGYELFVQQVIPQEPPLLGIAHTVALTWPVNGAAYQLESRPDVNSTEWSAVTNRPAEIDGRNTVLVPPAPDPRQVYRLRKTN
ncbi:MAG TPA: hypothetical protein PK640_03565 [Verrucomicrobiota bacterium]|nr:hypothetical protein [Verrucomicrobiota bacterium]